MKAMPSWVNNARFYHVFPMGFSEEQGLTKLNQWLTHIEQMQFNALYLSPIWQSQTDGYDTVDYTTVDNRLGDNEALLTLIDNAHQRHIHVVLEAVFTHVSRDFFAFKNLQSNLQDSPYTDWFIDVDFETDNQHRDGFCYQTWQEQGHLVQLNTRNEDVQHYIIELVEFWITEFNIDGLRLDLAEGVSLSLWHALQKHTQQYDDFWLVGEVVHGDYRSMLEEGVFHSLVNYELYKALWSSQNDINLYQIDYALNHQFGRFGQYPDQVFYNFLDAHDVSRVVSRLKDSRQLMPLYLLLYMVPGVPSVYYGSEWRAAGTISHGDNWHLRPSEETLITLSQEQQDLKDVIVRLNNLRQNLPSLSTGRYKALDTKTEFLSFLRDDHIYCVINFSHSSIRYELPAGRYRDELNGETLEIEGAVVVHPMWGRVLVRL